PAACARHRGGGRPGASPRRGRSAWWFRSGTGQRRRRCEASERDTSRPERTMRVVFLAPSYPPEMIEYTRGLAEVGAQVWGVGDTPREGLPPRVKPYLHEYLQVPRIMDEDDVMNRVTAWLKSRGIATVDRVLANWEPLVILAARFRERWGMPGMSVDAV